MDIIAVTETWASADIMDGEINIDGYTMFRKDRQHGKGGGVILYIKDNFTAAAYETAYTTEFSESVWCKIMLKNQELIVGVCYRSPASSEDNNNKLLSMLENTIKGCKATRFLVMGDFNCPGINFRDGYVSAGPASLDYKLFNKVQDLLFVETVLQETHFREGTVPSSLDYVFTDEENIIQDMQVDEALGKSDHAALHWRMVVEPDRTWDSRNAAVKFKYWKGDFVSIGKHLTAIDWPKELENKTVEDSWLYFRDTVKQLVNKFVPKQEQSTGRKKKSNLRRSIQKKIKQRNKCWKDYKTCPTAKNFAAYKKKRNEVDQAIKTDRDNARKSLLKNCKRNPKKFYGFMRRMQTVKAEVRQLSINNGRGLTTTDTEAADVLCEHFQQTFTKEDEFQKAVPAHIHTDDSIEIPFNKLVVQKKLERLKTDKSPGPDELHPLLLQSCAAQIAEPLSIIFQKSYTAGKLPHDWKTATVTPIYKKGNRTDPSNYRPISLTSVPCKVMESIVRDSLVSYLESEHRLTSQQHGFMKGRSCLTNLLETFESWTSALDEGFGIDVIYLDYRKAFDTVPHQRLIHKLSQIGITGKVLVWITEFLNDRIMKVNVRGSYSQWAQVISGVPQGSILGPLLFLMYVNDLPAWIKNDIKMFADDTKIWSKISSDTDSYLLQEDLDNIERWSQKWLLKLHPEKCKVMHVGHSYQTTYRVEDSGSSRILQVTEEEKDLGVHTTSDLKSSTQCNKAANKAMSILRMVNRAFRGLDKDDFLIVYKSFIRPHLEYCVQSWNPHFLKDEEVLEKVQKRATKCVKGLKGKKYPERLQILGLTTLKRRRIRGDLIETFKILSGKENVDSKTFFNLADSSRHTRGHSLKLYKRHCRLDVRKFFFTQRVVNIWNSLPQHVVEAPSVNSFKKRLDDYYQDMGLL